MAVSPSRAKDDCCTGGSGYCRLVLARSTHEVGVNAYFEACDHQINT